MNKETLVKTVKASFTLIAVFGPLTYALNQYGWDIPALFTPKYTPPKIDFKLGFKGVRLINRQLVLTYELQNLGEVGVELLDVEAFAYTPDMQPLTSVKLEKAVTSTPNSTQTFNIVLPLNNSIVEKLSQYFQPQGEVALRISGRLHIRILGSSVTAPIELTLQLKPEDLGLGKHGG